MSELDSLRRGLQIALGRPWDLPALPKELAREIKELRTLLGEGGGAVASRDRIHEAVSHFWQYGRFANLAEARLTCFGAIERFVPQRPALIDDVSAFPKLLDQIDDLSLDPRPFRRCYRGLVHCYFTYDPDAKESVQTGVRNWERLQEYLEARYDAVRVNGFEPEWVTALAESRHLLTQEPVRPYAEAALRGDTQDFLNACRAIEIAETSWLVRRLVLAQIDFAAKQSDERFKNYVAPLLGALDDHPVVKHEGLARLVNRYADASSQEEHKSLREAALTAWGNPLLQSNRPKWGRVTDEGRRLVANWIKRDLIQQFFEVLSEDRATDSRRVKFWEKYHDQMDGMYFALGNNARWSGDADIRTLRRKMGDLELSLVRGGSAANNAFIMLMGGYAVVEFGVTGNACFMFDRAALPFELRNEVAGDSTGLKHRRHKHRLLHVNTSLGAWEREFERVLNEEGIHAETLSTARPAQRQRVERPDPVTRRRATVRVATTFSRSALMEYVDYHGLKISDKTGIGGVLFVFHSDREGAIAEQLSRWGFKYGPHKRAWYRKGWR